MKVHQAQEVALAAVAMEGAQGCQVRSLVGPAEGAPNFAMRQFVVAPGGFTPRHKHPYEHEVFVLRGEGVVLDGEVERPLRPGMVVYVAPDDLHQFRNTGPGPLEFLCLVPNSAAGALRVSPECQAD